MHIQYSIYSTHRCHDHMVVTSTSTYVISDYLFKLPIH